MSDEITVRPQSAASVSEASPPAVEPDSFTPSSLGVIASALGLGLSFFLPWSSLLGKPLSGFDLQKLGDRHKLLWLIPVFSLITVLAELSGRRQRFAALLTGTLPFLALWYWVSQIGPKLMHQLDFGAWLSLGTGLALILQPWRLK